MLFRWFLLETGQCFCDFFATGDACQQQLDTNPIQEEMSDKKKVIIAAVGIFVCYFYFGIIQEKITRGRYGDELQEDGTRGERFTFMLALVGVQCICNWIFAKG